MKSFIGKEPVELLAIDFLSLEKGKGGFENILVVTDSFTKFSWAFPTRDQKATTGPDVAEADPVQDPPYVT